jgi:hypothetical protein
VDQLFSILTQRFKSQINTLEDLKEKIVKSGILPQPDVEVLDFIWDWKKFAMDNLAKEELRNHSKYHGFNIKKEKGQTRLRGKRYSFEADWNPPPGIRLLREDSTLEPIDVAGLRVEALNLPKVYQDLQRFFATLPLEERMTVQTSWENLKRKLENLPLRVDSLPKMDVSKLPVQSPDSQVVIPDHLAHINREDTIKDLEGDTFPEDLDEADFNEDLKEGLDVLIYSNIKHGRPWLGRIRKVTEDSKFSIQWYTRQKKGDQNMFYATNNGDGSPYTSELDAASVILWNFSTRINDSSFSVSKFFLSQFKVEYSRHDQLMIS